MKITNWFKANAAKARWEQETISAKETTKAEMEKKVAETQAAQKLSVAKLETAAAEQFKLAETLRGEGEAARQPMPVPLVSIRANGCHLWSWAAAETRANRLLAPHS